MDFRVNEDQQALQGGIRSFCEGRVPLDQLRALEASSGLDRELWTDLAEMGVFSLRLSEDEGGVGLGAAEAVLVFEELGRALVPGPLAWTHLAAGLVDGASDGSAVVGGSLDIDPTTNEIMVALDPNPQIYVEVVQIDDEGYQGVMTDLFASLLRIVVPRLLGDVLGSIPIPEFDLGALGLGINTTLSLSNGSLGRPNTSNSCVSGTELLSAGHFCLTGSLQ